jgi:predicted CopG family antitoxin
MAKSVRVHDDTHTALKRLKNKQRSASIDQVIREMIRTTTGSAVGQEGAEGRAEQLTKYLDR